MALPGGAPIRHPARLAIATAVAAGLATAAVVALPFLGFAYRAPALRAVLETLNAIIALLVAFLVYGRFRQSRRLQDLLIVLALCTVAVANLALTALPSAVAQASGEEFSRWEGLAIRLMGTVVLVAAALVSARVTVRRQTAAGVSVAGVVAVIAVTALLLATELPPTVDPAIGIADSTTPRLIAHPVVLGVQGLGAVLYGVAAVAFTRQSAHTRDALLRWVAAGCVLAAASRVHYLLFPSLYSDYVHTGDVLRLGFYLLMSVGAVTEIRSYWDLQMQAAVLDDRRRMARDLHDGLTQELTYIAAQAQRLASRPGDPVIIERLRAAAGRAGDEARRAITALTRPVDEPFTEALQRTADDLAHRHDVKIITEIDKRARLDAAQAEALLRVVAEAVRNAVRHGKAERIEIRLTTPPLSLAVIDDGRGFEVQDGRPGGFGLTSMRQRAEALGAAFDISCEPGEATTVRVTWP